MSNDLINVGIVGVAPGRSWSAISHIPALQSLSGYRINALSTTRMSSAEAAAKAFSVPHAFDNHHDLIQHPDVDLVVVTVKVPEHLSIVAAAIKARKAVYCEWPLGRNLEEAVTMEALSREYQVRTLAGLQARFSPVLCYAKALIDQGYLGIPLSATLIGSGIQWGEETQPANAYTADKYNGATLLSIPVGHTLDGLCWLLGEVTEVSGIMANRRTSAEVQPSGKRIALTAEDQVIAALTHASGVVTSVHYRGGVNRGTNFMLEINGTKADLRITADHGHAQFGSLRLFGGSGEETTLQPLAVPPEYQLASLAESPAHNVACLYAKFARSLTSSEEVIPDFKHALTRHRLIDAIERAASSGVKVSLG